MSAFLFFSFLMFYKHGPAHASDNLIASERERHRDTHYLYLCLLSPASSAVGCSPRRDLGIDLGAGLLCPRDERAGPGGAGGSPRDVEPGLMERRELPDL